MTTALQKRLMRSQLRADFDVAMRWFRLPDANVQIAKESAERSPVRAGACYRAIVLSLPREKGNSNG